MSRRVVVTGMGMVTPLGCSVDQTWQRMLKGDSGLGTITKFDAAPFKTTVAGEVKDFEATDLKSIYGTGEIIERVSEYGYLLGAVHEAVTQAGADIQAGDGLVITSGGTNRLPLREYVSILREQLAPGTFDELVHLLRDVYSDFYYLSRESRLPSHYLADLLGIETPPKDIHAACAGGAQVVAQGFDMIRFGSASRVVCAAVQAFDFLKFVSFTLLEAMSTHQDPPQKACRPFDKRRDGLVMAEGAAAIVLEDLDFALARGAPEIIAEVAGYGVTTDAYRLTDPHPEGTHSAEAMRRALRDAGIKAEDVDYINAHGTSTQANDKAETMAIKQVFGRRSYEIPVNATKSMVGHLLVGAGLVETIVTAMSLEQGWLHPTINLEHPDPECDLDYLSDNDSVSLTVTTALSNSFGFGGHNISLALKKYGTA